MNTINTLHLGMRTTKNKYIVRKIEQPKVQNGIILLSSIKVDNIVGEIITAPKGGIYKEGDMVVVHQSRRESFGGDYMSVIEQGIIARFNDPIKRDVKDVSVSNNYVLVKITADTEKIKVAGQELFIDTSWNEQFHAPTFGEVIQLPEKLVFNNNKLSNGSWEDEFSMANKTEIDIVKGDTVHFHYNTIFNAKNYSLVYEDNKELYVFLEYASLFFAERKGEIIMLNGYMAVEIESDSKHGKELESGLIMVDTRTSDRAKDWGHGIVRYKGRPNTDYTNWKGIDESEVDVRVGDKISFTTTKMSLFGQDMHIENEKLKGLYRMQIKDMLLEVERN